jgi:hypothetical protein
MLLWRLGKVSKRRKPEFSNSGSLCTFLISTFPYQSSTSPLYLRIPPNLSLFG